MGCDIHICAERKDQNGKWTRVSLPEYEIVLEERVYAWFAFLADVRNYGAVTPISEPRGIPEDASESTKEAHAQWDVDAHSASWLTLNELIDFDYEQGTEDRRVTRTLPSGLLHGGCTCEPGQGKSMALGEYLGEAFFKGLQQLQTAGAERIVFWFDN